MVQGLRTEFITYFICLHFRQRDWYSFVRIESEEIEGPETP